MKWVSDVFSKISVLFVFVAAGVFGGILIAITVIIAAPYVLFTMLFDWDPLGLSPRVAHTAEGLEEYHEVVSELQSGDTAALDARLAEDADFPNGVDGFIARHWLTNAIDLGTTETVAWFIKNGANVNYRDKEGRCPLDCAIDRDISVCKSAEEERLEVLTMLLNADADPNLPDSLDYTPLHLAAVVSSGEVIQLLLDHGADPLAYDRDFFPATPIHRAQATERHDIAEIMRAHIERSKTPPAP